MSAMPIPTPVIRDNKKIYRFPQPNHPINIIEYTDQVFVNGELYGSVRYLGQAVASLASFFLAATDDICDNYALTGQIFPSPQYLSVKAHLLLPFHLHIFRYTTPELNSLVAINPNLASQIPTYSKTIYKRLATPLIVYRDNNTNYPFTAAEFVQQNIVPDFIRFHYIQQIANQLFIRGEQLANRASFILASTKLEFAYCDSKIVLAGEPFDPLSSTYWEIAKTTTTKSSKFRPTFEQNEYRLSEWNQRRQQRHHISLDPNRTPPYLKDSVNRTYSKIFFNLTRSPLIPNRQKINIEDAYRSIT